MVAAAYPLPLTHIRQVASSGARVDAFLLRALPEWHVLFHCRPESPLREVTGFRTDAIACDSARHQSHFLPARLPLPLGAGSSPGTLSASPSTARVSVSS